MVRKIRGVFSSSGDQQEQPFVQVNVIVACGSSSANSSKWHRLASDPREFRGENRTNEPALLWVLIA
jgi:hypothetical protein